MNIKMAKKRNLSTIESKKQNKETRRTETESWIQSILMVARWERGVTHGMGEEVKGLRSTSWWLQNSHGDVKYGIVSGVNKELIHMTHGHEQWCGGCLRE